ncbi:facilitated trehalose transporter Tret1 [Haematobia irritans]|uniref:facilitated trehalose transporter Tret1 n=1 Tax=Haematobia irritans TaxID=7368 RepID=UPI003F4F8987
MSSDHWETIKLDQNGKEQSKPMLCSGMDHSRKTKPLGESRKAVWRQELMVFLGNTGVVGAGMSVALPSVTLGQLTNEDEEFCLSLEEASWFSAINTMACPLGGLLVGLLLDRIGRKNTILAFDVCGVLGWGLLATAALHTDRSAILIQMLIARFIQGIMIGLSVSPVGVYSAEISLPRIRGRLILGTSLGLAAGILFMYILGYFIRNDWQLISIISTVHQIISTLCALPMPETPSWLMQNGYSDKARRSLKYFRGLNKNDASYCEEFENELNVIKKTSEESRNTAKNESLWQAIKCPEVYKPLLIMVGFFGFQQCSGVVAVVVFAVQIATQAGVTIDPVLCAVMVGVARIITTFFMSTIFEKWGRKMAGIVSASGMTLCMMLLALSGWFPEAFNRVPPLPIVCIVLHIVFSTMGLLTLPFFMISEVFPQRVRGSAAGFAVSLGLIISFVVLKLFPTMDRAIGTANVFAFFGAVSLTAVAFIYFLVPETRGRTLLEIEEYFKTGRMPLVTEVRLSNGNDRNARCDDEECKESFLKT